MISYTLMTYPMIYYTNSTHHFLFNSNNAFGYVLSHRINPTMIHCWVNAIHISECFNIIIWWEHWIKIISFYNVYVQTNIQFIDVVANMRISPHCVLPAGEVLLRTFLQLSIPWIMNKPSSWCWRIRIFSYTHEWKFLALSINTLLGPRPGQETAWTVWLPK